MATLDDILNLGNIPIVDPVSNRLPTPVEATLPVAIGKGVANGVAALNASGLPVDTSGRPMAVIGTASGQAADAAVVTAAINAVGVKADAAQTTAAKSAVYFYATGTSYTGRPVTAPGQPVIWATPTVAPPAVFGTVTSQTGPVDGLDIVLLSSGLQVAT